jgi:hypothetical protein
MIRKIFNNRAFVITLAVCSGLLMLRSIAAPFLAEPDFGDVEDPEFYLDADASAFADGSGHADEGMGEPEIWRADQSVLSGQLTWNASPRRDPFAPGLEGPEATAVVRREAWPQQTHGLPRLNALIAGPVSHFAVLDDRIVREGDLIGGYQVTRISPDGVRIASLSETHWLSVSNMAYERDIEAGDARLDEPVDELAGLLEGGEPGG